MKAGDGSSLQLPPAFVLINPRQHRRYKKGNQDQVDGRTSGAKDLMSRINKRKMKKEEYLDERLFPGVASRMIKRNRAAKIMQGKEVSQSSANRIKELDKQGGRFGKPLTDMARNFHLRNGAEEVQVNEETQNFEYKIIK